MDSIDLIKIHDILENKKIRKIDSLEQIYSSKVQIDFSEDTVYINWNFFLGRDIPIQYLSKRNQEFDEDGPILRKLEKEWNIDTENFLLNLNSQDIHNFIKYSQEIIQEQEVVELFFTNNLLQIISNSFTYKNELIETRKETNQELIKIEMEVNEFKLDNECLIKILNENDNEIKSLNEEICHLKRENILNKDLNEIYYRDILDYENLNNQLKNEMKLLLTKYEIALNEIKTFEKQNIDLCHEIDILQSNNNKKKCFPFF
jgi:hypothetical protein